MAPSRTTTILFDHHSGSKSRSLLVPSAFLPCKSSSPQIDPAAPALPCRGHEPTATDCYGRLTNEIPWDNMTYQQTKTYSKITNQSVSKISVTTLDWIRIYESSVQAVLQLLLSRQSLSSKEAIGDSVDICWYPYLSLSICHRFDVETPSMARLIIPKRHRLCFGASLFVTCQSQRGGILSRSQGSQGSQWQCQWHPGAIAEVNLYWDAHEKGLHLYTETSFDHEIFSRHAILLWHFCNEDQRNITYCNIFINLDQYMSHLSRSGWQINNMNHWQDIVNYSG
jgi:hypothetical protein